MTKRYENVDFCDPKTHAQPNAYEMYNYFLEHEPIHWDAKNELWQVFRYDDIIHIERDPQTFCNSEGVRPHLPPDPGMISQDGEQHTKQRALVSKGFTPRQMRKMEDHVEKIVDELLSFIIEKGECDIVKDLATVLPARLTSDILGTPEEERKKVNDWVSQLVSGGQGPDYVDDKVNNAFEHFTEYHEAMVEQRQAIGCPGSDLLTIWMNAEIDGEKLDESQLLFEHILLYVGGAETTRNAIAGGLEQLTAHPEQYDALYKNPDLVPNAVEESLRWVTPFVNMYRTATRNVKMHGKTIEQGQMIGMNYIAANRDPKHFQDPYKFDIFRDFNKENSRHLSFGFGTHFCLGASLARLETQISFRMTTQRIKRIRIPEGKKPTYLESSFRRGLLTFPAIVEPR